MSLKHRKDVETSELKGVVLAVDEAKIKPGVFTRLTNWIPSGIGSIQKKRGILGLTSTPITPQAPTEDCDFVSTEPIVEFRLSASTVEEAEGTHIVQVRLLHSFTDVVTVDYDVTGGTAVGGGVDYTLANGTVTFAIGEVLKDITITLAADDATIEDPKTIEITLSAPTNATLGDLTVHTVTILDDDQDPPVDEGVLVWLAAYHLSETFVDGDALTDFTDESGEEVLIHAVGSPRYRDNAVDNINGLPVIEFDGVNDYIWGNFQSLFTEGGASFFMVGRLAVDPPVDAAKTGSWHFASDLASGDSNKLPETTGVVLDGAFSTERKTVGNPAPALTSPFQLNIISSDAGWTLRVNGTTVFTTATNTFAAPEAFQLGKSLGDFFYNGVIGEVIIIDGAVSNAARNLIETYFTTVWSL